MLRAHNSIYGFGAHERALHPIRLPRHTVEDLGKGVRGDIGVGGTIHLIGDIHPISLAVLFLYPKGCYPELIGDPNGGAGERQMKLAAAHGRHNHAIALEVVAGLNLIRLRQGGERRAAEQNAENKKNGNEFSHSKTSINQIVSVRKQAFNTDDTLLTR